MQSQWRRIQAKHSISRKRANDFLWTHVDVKGAPLPSLSSSLFHYNFIDEPFIVEGIIRAMSMIQHVRSVGRSSAPSNHSPTASSSSGPTATVPIGVDSGTTSSPQIISQPLVSSPPHLTPPLHLPTSLPVPVPLHQRSSHISHHCQWSSRFSLWRIPF